MQTYIKDGKPLIRSCANCIHYRGSQEFNNKAGYCQAKPLMFAYTMELTVSAIVKSFSLCKDHFFTDENDFVTEKLKTVQMKSILKGKNELQK